MQDEKPANYYQNVRPEMMAYVPADSSRVLEVGCGEGEFGWRVKQSGAVEVWGIELVEARARLAATRLDKVLVGDVADLVGQLPSGHFDAVVFNDVLEHLVDPFEVLRRVRPSLSEGGVVVSSIPNVRFFPVAYGLAVYGEWEYDESGILDRTHLRFFTGRSIQRMYERLGYEILRHEGINREAHMPARYHILNAVLRGRLADMRFAQFATVARPRPGADSGP